MIFRLVSVGLVVSVLCTGCLRPLKTTSPTRENSDEVVNEPREGGKVLWSVRENLEMDEYGMHIASFDDGSVAVLSSSEESGTLGKNETPLDEGVFVAKYDPDGKLMWARGGWSGVPIAITGFPDGSLTIIGLIRKATVFGKGEANETAVKDRSGPFIIKYNGDGTLAWARQSPLMFNKKYLAYGLCKGGDIAGFKDGSMVIAGQLEDSNAGVIKLSSDGKTIWKKQTKTDDDENAICDLAVFPDDAVAVTGVVSQGGRFASSSILSNAKSSDLFVAKLNAGGKLIWATGLGSDEFDIGKDVAALSDGSIVAVGIVGGEVLVAKGEANETRLTRPLFIARFGPNGKVLWVQSPGGSVMLSGIATQPNDSVVVGGLFHQTAVFGKDQPNETRLTSPEGDNTWIVVEYDLNGKVVWAKSSDKVKEYALGIGTHPDCSASLAGSYLGPVPGKTRKNMRGPLIIKMKGCSKAKASDERIQTKPKKQDDSETFLSEIRKQLVASGVDLEAHQNEGWTLLHYALDAEKTKIAKALIGKGIDINELTYDKTSPLHMAAEKGLYQCSTQLVDAGANMDAQTFKGNTPLYEALWHEHKELAEWFVKKGAKTNLYTKSNISALHIAINKGYAPLVDLMVFKGADVNGIEDKPPIFFAISWGHKKIVQILLGGGADVEARKDNSGETALSMAVRHNKRELIDMFLKRGPSAYSKHRALYHATREIRYDLMKKLINAGAVIDSDIHDLMFAVLDSREDVFGVVKLLVDSGADVNKSHSHNGVPLLHEAIRGNHYRTAMLFIKHGARVKEPYHDGSTPLYWAADRGRPELVLALLERGANVHTKMKKPSGRTPLFAAAGSGNMEVITLLIERGANVNEKADNGTTPLFSAVNNKKTAAIELLIQKGAKVNICNDNKRTPLYLAKRARKKAIVELLLRHGADESIKCVK
ncbi:MAG: hypothetical protein GY854_02525 [Deltaproteobacteria bacterium]|nr:hypothetical protein [Deltaproteobacteria bacterium]